MEQTRAAEERAARLSEEAGLEAERCAEEAEALIGSAAHGEDRAMLAIEEALRPIDHRLSPCHPRNDPVHTPKQRQADTGSIPDRPRIRPGLAQDRLRHDEATPE